MIKLKMSIWLCILIFHVFSQADMIIDRAGNMIECHIVDTLKSEVTYTTVSGIDTATHTIGRDSVFMIKYHDGTKRLFSDRQEKVSVQIPAQVEEYRKEIAFLLSYGAFGLFNVNNDSKQSSYGEYTFGGSVVVDYRIKNLFYCGVECIFRWAQSETADPVRLLIDPYIRSKLLFPIRNNLILGPLVGVGMTIWPRTEGTPELHETYLNTRLGWAGRAALEIDYLISNRVSFSSELGYSISSSSSQDIWISHDMMLISLGVRWRI